MPGDLRVLGLLHRLAAAARDADERGVVEVHPREVAGDRGSGERDERRRDAQSRGRSPGERVVQCGAHLIDGGDLDEIRLRVSDLDQQRRRAPDAGRHSGCCAPSASATMSARSASAKS